MILSAANEHMMMMMGKHLNDPSTALKSYWPIFNWLLNNKKIPSTPPIFHITVKLYQTSNRKPPYLIHILLPMVHLYLTPVSYLT